MREYAPAAIRLPMVIDIAAAMLAIEAADIDARFRALPLFSLRQEDGYMRDVTRYDVATLRADATISLVTRAI